MGVKQLLALVVSSAKFTLDLLQVMVRVPVIVQFVMCLKHLKNIIVNKTNYFRFCLMKYYEGALN